MTAVQSDKGTRSARVGEFEAGSSVGSGDDLHDKPVRQIGWDASNLERYGFYKWSRRNLISRQVEKGERIGRGLRTTERDVSGNQRPFRSRFVP